MLLPKVHEAERADLVAHSEELEERIRQLELVSEHRVQEAEITVEQRLGMGLGLTSGFETFARGSESKWKFLSCVHPVFTYEFCCFECQASAELIQNNVTHVNNVPVCHQKCESFRLSVDWQ